MSDTTTPPTSDRDDAASPDWDALARYQAGESPDAESRAVAAWLAAHPDDAALLARIDAAVAHATARPADDDATIDVEAALRRVQARRDGEQSAPTPVAAPTRDMLPLPRKTTPIRVTTRLATPQRRQPVARWVGGGLAAAAAIAALAVGLVRRQPASSATVAGGALPPAPHAAVTMLAAGGSFATPVGVRDSVRLPDGTGVVLAPGSRVSLAADYGAARRDVTLDGAALFTVRHDAAHEFAVRAGGAVVRDVGTTFAVRTDGVRAADDGGGVAVLVTEGAVALRAATASARDTGVVLAAGDRGELHADGRVVAARGAVSDDDIAWARGRLVYAEAPLAVVRADLRRWYGVELEFADASLAESRLTATFENEPAARVLDVVALALGATVERSGNVAVLRRAPAAAAAAPAAGRPR